MDGISFETHPIEIQGIQGGDIGLGIAWGKDNTIWGKALNRSLFHIAIDIENGTGTVLKEFSSPAIDNGIAPLGSAPNSNRLGGINVSQHSFTLFDVTNPEDSPIFVASDVFATSNANPNGVGAMDFGEDVFCCLGNK